MGNIVRDILSCLFGAERFKVFVLEDNQLFLKGLEAQLIQTFDNDIDIKSFQTSNEMLVNLSECPHIILMDYHLDDRSKLEGLALIKQLKWSNPSSKIIVLTCEDKPKTAYECYEAGADNYIIKSISSIKKVMKEIMYRKDLLRTA